MTNRYKPGDKVKYQKVHLRSRPEKWRGVLTIVEHTGPMDGYLITNGQEDGPLYEYGFLLEPVEDGEK